MEGGTEAGRKIFVCLYASTLDLHRKILKKSSKYLFPFRASVHVLPPLKA